MRRPRTFRERDLTGLLAVRWLRRREGLADPYRMHRRIRELIAAIRGERA